MAGEGAVFDADILAGVHLNDVPVPHIFKSNVFDFNIFIVSHNNTDDRLVSHFYIGQVDYGLSFSLDGNVFLPAVLANHGVFGGAGLADELEHGGIGLSAFGLFQDHAVFQDDVDVRGDEQGVAQFVGALVDDQRSASLIVELLEAGPQLRGVAGGDAQGLCLGLAAGKKGGAQADEQQADAR